ncbi:MAG TPA: hypothetical protein VHG53_01495 [Candidatus Limnocylindria bacterium]|nr:hypothetical protein [Candidatus Limnocylindria bacterium]
MVGRKRQMQVAEIEIPVDFAARVGGAEPREEPAPDTELVRRRHDGPIETTRVPRSAARGAPTDEWGRPFMIGAQEPRPAPLAAPGHTDERSGRPLMIGVEEALSVKIAADAAAEQADPAEGPAEWELGEMSLVATPLATPDDWHHFELALRSVRGISGFRTEYYRAGILKLRLRWTGAGRFATAITQIPGYRVGILGEDRTTVQVRVART